MVQMRSSLFLDVVQHRLATSQKSEELMFMVVWKMVV